MRKIISLTIASAMCFIGFVVFFDAMARGARGFIWVLGACLMAIGGYWIKEDWFDREPRRSGGLPGSA